MKKMKFNEGGQPVFLDDLKVLQELCLDQLAAIVRSFCNDEAVLMSTLVKKQTVVSANAVFVDGVWVSVPAADVMSENAYVSIWKVADNMRSLQSGSSSACSYRYYAQWTASADSSATWSFNGRSLKSIEGLITHNDFKELSGTWHNGFSGKVSICRGVGTTKIIVIANASGVVSSGLTDIFTADEYVPDFCRAVRVYQQNHEKIAYIEGYGGINIRLSTDDWVNNCSIKEIFEALT